MQVPAILAASGAQIYIYYGNENAISDDWTADPSSTGDTLPDGVTPLTNAQQVWSDGPSGNYSAVWHFGTSTSASFTTDSASNIPTTNGNGVDESNNVQPGQGEVSSGGVINDSWMSVPYQPDLDLSGGNFTIESWFKANAFHDDAADPGQMILSTDTLGVNFDWCIYLYNSSTIEIATDATASSIFVSVPTMSASNWYNVAIVGTDGWDSIYLNGVAYGTPIYMPLSNDVQNYTLLGASHWNAPAVDYSGNIDEVRLSQYSHSAAWQAFEYANIANAGNDETFGSPESAPVHVSETGPTSGNIGTESVFTATAN